MRKYRKYKLLILDEWLLYPLKESEARDLLALIETRSQVLSTIFCPQFDIPGWHKLLYNPTLVDAICERIVYNLHGLTIKGEFMRRLNAISDPSNGVAVMRDLCDHHTPFQRNACPTPRGFTAPVGRNTHFEALFSFPNAAVCEIKFGGDISLRASGDQKNFSSFRFTNPKQLACRSQFIHKFPSPKMSGRGEINFSKSVQHERAAIGLIR